jgi:hypothetical protein
MIPAHRSRAGSDAAPTALAAWAQHPHPRSAALASASGTAGARDSRSRRTDLLALSLIG